MVSSFAVAKGLVVLGMCKRQDLSRFDVGSEIQKPFWQQ